MWHFLEKDQFDKHVNESNYQSINFTLPNSSQGKPSQAKHITHEEWGKCDEVIELNSLEICLKDKRWLSPLTKWIVWFRFESQEENEVKWNCRMRLSWIFSRLKTVQLKMKLIFGLTLSLVFCKFSSGNCTCFDYKTKLTDVN